jgi:2-thiouracil desulfurase
MAIGLGSPRETLRLTTAGRLVNRSGTADYTAAVAAVPLPAGLDGYVLKSRSPTCGVHGIARYGEAGEPADHRGRGAFAQRLMAAFPLLPVEEGRLNDDLLCEAFAERVFAAARLRELLSAPWRPRDLIAFHARHKLQLLAHDPGRYRLAGRVSASPSRCSPITPAAARSPGSPTRPAVIPGRTPPAAQRASRAGAFPGSALMAAPGWPASPGGRSPIGGSWSSAGYSWPWPGAWRRRSRAADKTRHRDSLAAPAQCVLADQPAEDARFELAGGCLQHAFQQCAPRAGRG